MTLRPIAALLLSLGVAAGCNSPSAPGNVDKWLTLEGPPSVAPGASAIFRAVVYDSDNNKSDVSDSATWSSRQSEIVEMQSEVAIGRLRGETWIDVKVGDQTASKRVLVLEAGTRKYSARIVDAETELGISGATVEVVGGTGTGLKTTTLHNDGLFTLYGLKDNAVLRVTADGYGSTTLDVFARDATVDRLAVIAQETNGLLAGNWTMRLSAPGCELLPEGARTRQFAARISHAGTSNFFVMLSSPSVHHADPFRGSIIGSAIAVFITWFAGDSFDGPSYGLVDTLQPRGYLGIRGTVLGTLDGSGVTGTLEGALDHYSNNVVFGGATTCPGPGAVVPIAVTLTREAQAAK